MNDAGDHYATLGLDRDCSAAQIRAAYRSLAKRHHPDVNQNAAGARARTEALNAAHEILGNPARRRAYDRELDRASQATAPARGAPIVNDITQDVHLRIEDFLRGTSLRVEVNDPAHPDGVESYPVNI
ncbi:MAG TPA: J domain-containing protein, partial [Chthoniobacterales bacterium]|nr:J domain-containing protein [Chthoniobacterales bacterium]